MSHTLAEIRAEYDRLDALCGVDTHRIALELSTRCVRRLGCFRPGPPLSISISAFVLEEDSVFLDTIRHEYAHALVFLRRPHERHGHDAVWRAACREVGCTPRATVSAASSQRELRAENARWRLLCRGCGQETFYLREGKIVRLLRCGRTANVKCTKCGGHRFELTCLQQKPQGDGDPEKIP